MATKRGYELAANLAGAIGYTNAIAETCSLIARHERTLHRYAEIECNGSMPWQERGEHMSEEQTEWLEKRIEQLQARVTRLVEDLPHTDDGPFIVIFNGDPRGAAVKLNAPGASSDLLRGKDWGGDVAV